MRLSYLNNSLVAMKLKLLIDEFREFGREYFEIQLFLKHIFSAEKYNHSYNNNISAYKKKLKIHKRI